MTEKKIHHDLSKEPIKINECCKYDLLMNISEVKKRFDPENTNTHSKDSIRRMSKVLKFQGWDKPIVISSNTDVLNQGHKRTLGAELVGQKWIPVVYRKFDSIDQEKAASISDNSTAQESKLDMSLINKIVLDFDPITLEDPEILGIQDFSPVAEDKYADKDADEIPETKQNELGVKTGDLWILGNHRLLCGDATSKEDVERLMDGQKADFCFTSPPYSDQRDYNGDLNLDPKHLAKFLTHNCDIFAVNLGYARKDKEVFPYWQDYIDVAKSNGLKLLSWNVWDRGLPFSIGQQTAMFPIEHEWIFVFGKDTVDLIPTVDNKHAGAVQSVTNRQKDGSMSSSKKYSVRDKRSLGTICRNHVDRESNIKHPAKFPVSLVQSYIEAFSGKTILEPFCGSGSTLIACEKTQRRCFGMEIDPHYCSVIIKRWETFTGKKAHKLEKGDSNE